MKDKLMSIITRPRYWLFAVLLITIPLMDYLFNTDSGVIDNLPFGASLITYMILLGRATLAVLALHWLLTYIFDCEYLDLVKMSKAYPENNGQYAIALGLIAVAFAIVIQAVISL
jgi:hypothetical protein